MTKKTAIIPKEYNLTLDGDHVRKIEFIDDVIYIWKEEGGATKVIEASNDNTCPLCHSDNLLRQGKCVTCADCWWSACEI